MLDIPHSSENETTGTECSHSSLPDLANLSCTQVKDLLVQERLLSAELKYKIKTLEDVVLNQRTQLEEENASLRVEMVRLADLIVEKSGT